MSQPGTCQVTAIDDGLIVSVAGDIDYNCSPTLRMGLKQQLDQNPERLIIDLADVSYMDSSGVATLVEALQMQTKRQKKLVLCNLQDRVRGIFEIARLDMVFTIVADLGAAKTA